MNTIDLKPLVEAAVHREWEAFAADHPNLAKVLSEELLIEKTFADLQQDAEYHKAMLNASVMEAGADIVGALIDGLVQRVLKKLL